MHNQEHLPIRLLLNWDLIQLDLAIHPHIQALKIHHHQLMEHMEIQLLVPMEQSEELEPHPQALTEQLLEELEPHPQALTEQLLEELEPHQQALMEPLSEVLEPHQQALMEPLLEVLEQQELLLHLGQAIIIHHQLVLQ